MRRGGRGDGVHRAPALPPLASRGARPMPELHVLRVFCGDGGGGGNPLGVFLDGARSGRRIGRGSPRTSGSARRCSSTMRPRRDPDLHAGGGDAVRRASGGRDGLAAGAASAARSGAATAGRRGSGARGGRADLRRRPPGVGAGVRVRAGRIGRPRSRRSRASRRATEQWGCGRGSTRTRGSCASGCSPRGTGSPRTRRPARRRSRSPPGWTASWTSARAPAPGSSPAPGQRDGGDRRAGGAGRGAGVRRLSSSGGAGNRTQTSRLKVCSPTFGPRPQAGL